MNGFLSNDYETNLIAIGYTSQNIELDGRLEKFRAVNSFKDDGKWYDWALVEFEDINSGHKSQYASRIAVLSNSWMMTQYLPLLLCQLNQ